jgi:hypothetical protein
VTWFQIIALVMGAMIICFLSIIDSRMAAIIRLLYKREDRHSD